MNVATATPARRACRPDHAAAQQGTLDELGMPLREVTFVVVDLETTGGSPTTAAITEVGAVRVRGGEVLGEFSTLVNPGSSIPPFIAVLTGITDALVARSPRLTAVLPAFLEFAQDSVLVAHNAPFDVGFLKAGCGEHGYAWPGFPVVDTARLARQVLTRDDAPDCRLATLARLFRAGTVPNHRALPDARATVDVLHGLLERLGRHGVHSLEELTLFSSRVSPSQRHKRHLASGLPTAPGVYTFRDASGRALYVGKSRDIRTRVRSYFTAAETRRRMAEMVALTETVTPIVCATALEAEVRELRLIAEHKPPYNRRLRFPERATWLKLTVEAFPRLSFARGVRDDGAAYLGPFGTRRAAQAAAAAVHEAIPLRQCTERLSPRRRRPACALADLGRCGAPCEGRQTVSEYAVHAAAVRDAFSTDARLLVDPLRPRLQRLAVAQRYEDAARHRDRLATFLRAAARMQRLAALTSCTQLVAARSRGKPTEQAWELAVVRSGRLVGSAVASGTAVVRPTVQALLATAEPVLPGPGPTPAALPEETECILRWLEAPGTRLVELDGVWASPRHGAGGHRDWGDAAAEARRAVQPFADRRALRPTHRPVGPGTTSAGPP